ncbi:phage tail protein [Phytoactinopolyspora alkaliphila]|uniref:Phage tail protein n=1 Tax=Phytoactinopolyspora alkaliphila TaxID=1783498 RepID=A0A6N9YFI7_9ACTN|nr:phage tail protein [Phytoactinopolyspora alkaliphila]NED93722.1 phage tail protein [Phytoactinopolyspora alkaliphila]
MAASGLFKNDPIIAQNFFLEIDGQVITALMTVSGLDIEVGVMKVTQGGADGMKQQVKSLGQAVETPDLQLTRVAPLDSTSDPMWKWFEDIRTGGLSANARDAKRKNGSVVLYDSSREEVARFNFFSGWPSKISTDQLSVDGGEAVKETITLVIERLERVK